MNLIDMLLPLEFLNIENYEEYERSYIVIGTGITGLKAALEIAKEDKVSIITKSKKIETNTRYAQGGIAVVLAKEDNFDLHIEDTNYAGAGLCDKEPVEVLVKEGPARIKELIQIDTKFDRKEDGKLSMTKEAAHSKRRILHAGDTTGAEVERALTEEVLKNENIETLEYHFLIDILSDNSVLIYDAVKKRYKVVYFKGIIMATGSIGEIFLNTSNPTVATGDGLAIAYRNNIELSDMEFVQFHPTTFYKDGVPRFLISESLRGEGGILKNKFNEKFMNRYDSDAELAPRDVVSRSILREIELTKSECVYLDMTMHDKEFLFRRFPNISEFCLQYGIDISKDFIPVSPAAHYMMGGITSDINGRSNKKYFYSAGEVSRTGVHGANRLASNSLLEGLVFGKRAADTAKEECRNIKIEKKNYKFNKNNLPNISKEKIEEIKCYLKEIMWENVGILRDERRLKEAIKKIEKLTYELKKYSIGNDCIVEGVELINMLTVGYLVTKSAINRKESRGAHFRLDYPNKIDEFGKHSITIKLKD